MQDNGWSELDPGHTPRDRRRPIALRAWISAGEEKIDCTVTNISGDGCRVSSERKVVFPEQVTIELDRGGIWTATRRWQRGLRAGFQFNEAPI